jgi:hypothetical protein
LTNYYLDRRKRVLTQLPLKLLVSSNEDCVAPISYPSSLGQRAHEESD